MVFSPNCMRLKTPLNVPTLIGDFIVPKGVQQEFGGSRWIVRVPFGVQALLDQLIDQALSQATRNHVVTMQIGRKYAANNYGP